MPQSCYYQSRTKDLVGTLDLGRFGNPRRRLGPQVFLQGTGYLLRNRLELAKREPLGRELLRWLEGAICRMSFHNHHRGPILHNSKAQGA